MASRILFFSAVTVFLVTGMLLTAGGQQTSGETATASQTAATGSYNESPMLQARVAAGALPPVEERLPEEPFVVGQGVLIEDEYLDFEIGQYGGTLRLVHDRVGWNPDVFIMGNEPLVMAPTGDISVKGIRGNILHSFQVSDDNKVFTFRMRKGLKWSDGVPVTMDDVRFTHEDVLMNDLITSSVPGWLRAGNKRDGEPMMLNVVDPWTFRVSFSEPYGGFLAQLAIVIWRGYNYVLKPKHYLEQFHADHAPLKDLEPMIKEAGFDEGEWWNLFRSKDFNRTDLFRPKGLGIPSLAPWVMTDTSPELVLYERNPYYFKVDEDGNQLPYIDRLRDAKTADTEMSNFKVITGEVDYFREGGSLVNLPLYKENEEKSGFRTMLYKWVSTNVILPNHTFADPVWRELIADVRFRQALNMALNREELMEAVSYGFASLPEVVPSEYDTDRANELLDEMGLNRDAEGWRLRADGERLVISIENSSRHPDFIPTIELVVEYWRALGIEVNAQTIATTLQGQRASANELMMTIEALHTNIWRTANGFHHDYLPRAGTWAPLWYAWYNSNGEAGEEPPPDVKRLFELSEELGTAIPDSPAANRALDEIYRNLHDNIYFFVTLEKIKKTQLVSARLGNVPTEGHSVGVNYSVEQMFFRN